MESSHRPLPTLTRAQVREVDRIAIEEFGIPSVVLMENAGRGAAEAILRAGRDAELGPFRGVPYDRVAILCGAGNNGGDGYVVARHLAAAEIDVVLLESADPDALSTDAAIFRAVTARMQLAHRSVNDGAALRAIGGELVSVTLWVDALLGTGFEGSLRARSAGVLEAAQSLLDPTGAKVVALDVPSGMDVDSGVASLETLPATRTYTFAAPKIGFEKAIAAPFVGTVEVIDIGAPWSVFERLA